MKRRNIWRLVRCWTDGSRYNFTPSMLIGQCMERRRAREDSIDFAFPFFSFVADLVDGQRRARPQFGGRFPLLVFGLASEREKGRR